MNGGDLVCRNGARQPPSLSSERARYASRGAIPYCGYSGLCPEEMAVRLGDLCRRKPNVSLLFKPYATQFGDSLLFPSRPPS